MSNRLLYWIGKTLFVLWGRLFEVIDISLPCVKCYTCQVCITCEKYGCQVGEAGAPQQLTVPPQQQWIVQPQQQWTPQPQQPIPTMLPPQFEKRVREIIIEVLTELGLIEVKGRRTIQ